MVWRRADCNIVENITVRWRVAIGLLVVGAVLELAKWITLAAMVVHH